MAWSYTFDITTPAFDDDPSEADDRMREIKGGSQERLNVDHYFPLTGSEVSDLDAGEHRKVTIRTLSVVEVAALAGAKAYLYRLVTDGELYFKDASGNTIQLTSGGKILSASLDMLDEDNMASDSAVHVATQQSIKAYADAVAVAAAAAAAVAIDAAIAAYVTLSAYTNQDTDGNAMLKTHAYKASTDGYVSAVHDVAYGAGRGMKLYVGGTNDPFGAGDLVQRMENDGSTYNNYYSVTYSIAKDEYFEIRVYSGTPVIRWRSKGTLIEPVDHN